MSYVFKFKSKNYLCLHIIFISIAVLPINTYGQSKRLDSLKKTLFTSLDSFVRESTINNVNQCIFKKTDEFSGAITYFSIASEPISFMKVKTGSTTKYFISIHTYDDDPHYNTKGVFILFTDRSKWVRPNQIVKLNYNDGFKYSSIIELSPHDLIIFQTKRISKFRLDQFEEEVYDDLSTNLILQANLIESKK
jgi:hypothetical protein